MLLVLVRGVYKPPKLKHFGPRLCPPGPRMASHMVAQMTSNSSVLWAQCAVIQSPSEKNMGPSLCAVLKANGLSQYKCIKSTISMGDNFCMFYMSFLALLQQNTFIEKTHYDTSTSRVLNRVVTAFMNRLLSLSDPSMSISRQTKAGSFCIPPQVLPPPTFCTRLNAVVWIHHIQVQTRITTVMVDRFKSYQPVSEC